MLVLQCELSFLLMSYVIGIVRVLVLLSIINNERLLTTQRSAVGSGRQGDDRNVLGGSLTLFPPGGQIMPLTLLIHTQPNF